MPIKKFKDPAKLAPIAKLSTKKTLKAPNPASGSELASPLAKRHNKEFFKDKWGKITGKVLEWLDGVDETTGVPRLNTLLEKARLTEVATFAGIGTDKVLLFEGSPTQIIGQHEQRKLEELIPALLDEVKRRGVKTEVTERKVSLTLPPNV